MFAICLEKENGKKKKKKKKNIQQYSSVSCFYFIHLLFQVPSSYIHDSRMIPTYHRLDNIFLSCSCIVKTTSLVFVKESHSNQLLDLALYREGGGRGSLSMTKTVVFFQKKKKKKKKAHSRFSFKMLSSCVVVVFFFFFFATLFFLWTLFLNIMKTVFTASIAYINIAAVKKLVVGSRVQVHIGFPRW